MAADRRRDVNLNLAVLDHQGTVDFLENSKDLALSHIRGLSKEGQAEGESRSYRVACDTLENIVARYANGRLINFLKIDAEGSEPAIVKSTDWRKIRPQVIVIEAVKPWTNQLVSDAWEPFLLAAGYKRGYFDGLNLFFVRDEDAELLRHFDRPLNELDWFKKYDPEKVAALEELHKVKKSGSDPRLDDATNEVNRALSAERDALDMLTTTRARLSSLQESNAQLTARYNGLLVDLDHALAEQNQLASALDAARTDETDKERLIEQLKHQLDRIGAELERLRPNATRYDILVHRLRVPDGPRVIRMVLPLARLLRLAFRILGGRHRSRATINRGEIVNYQPIADGALPKANFSKRMLWSIYLLVGRPIVRPIAWRARTFMLASITPGTQQIEVMAREIAALRQEIQDLGVRGSHVSPELAKSIESLMLTLAVCSPRE
jgi:FkbM family methyltransferase